jgi:hypothetical protein
MEEAEALRQAYQAEQNRRCRLEPTLDSGIDIPSSRSVIQSASLGAIQSSSPGVSQSASPAVSQPASPAVSQSASLGVIQSSSLGVIQPSSPPINQPGSPPAMRSSSPPIDQPSSPDLLRLERVTSKASQNAIVEEVDFQRQQMQRRQAQAYARNQAQAECQAAWELEQKLTEWVGRCPVCFIRGFPESGHSIIDCVEEGAVEVRIDWFRMKDRMRDGQIFAAFSCCYNCYVLQAICSKWAHENGRWRFLPNGTCQFDQIIMPVVISGINEGTDQTCNIIWD